MEECKKQHLHLLHISSNSCIQAACSFGLGQYNGGGFPTVMSIHGHTLGFSTYS